MSMVSLFHVLRHYGVSYHSYTDLSGTPDGHGPIYFLYQYVEEVNNWMKQNSLKLNKEKTKIIIFGNKPRRVSERILTVLKFKVLLIL